jgi:molybdopterin-binding protein
LTHTQDEDFTSLTLTRGKEAMGLCHLGALAVDHTCLDVRISVRNVLKNELKNVLI